MEAVVPEARPLGRPEAARAEVARVAEELILVL